MVPKDRRGNRSADRQQHAVAKPAATVASEIANLGDQFGARRDEAGAALGAGAQLFEPLPQLSARPNFTVPAGTSTPSLNSATATASCGANPVIKMRRSR